jgi:dihydroflavonol-4-reductase
LNTARRDGTCVIHTAALISIAEKMPPRLHAVNVDGVKNMLRLCREYRVRGWCTSAPSMPYPELPGRGRSCGSRIAFSAGLVNGGYAKTKAEAAQAVLDAAAEGLDAVIVFPSGHPRPLRRRQEPSHTDDRRIHAGKAPGLRPGRIRFRGCAGRCPGLHPGRGIRKKGTGLHTQRHNISLKELLALTGKYCGRSRSRRCRRFLAKLAVPLIGAYSRARGTRPLYTAYSLSTVSGNSCFSNEKAKRELHYTVRDIGETVRDMVEWMKPENRM